MATKDTQLGDDTVTMETALPVVLNYLRITSVAEALSDDIETGLALSDLLHRSLERVADGLGIDFIARLQPDETQPKPLPELIVCQNEPQAKKIRASLSRAGLHHIRAISPTPAQLAGAPAALITVLPGVNLDQDVGGQGTLRALLHSRMKVWRDHAALIEL